MLEIVRESLIIFFIAAAVSAVLAPFIINMMYKLGQVKIAQKTKLADGTTSNELFLKVAEVERTNGTPNMGGILIWIVVPLVALFTLTRTVQINILILGFIILGFWGLIDVLFTNAIKGKKNEKLRAFQETFEWRLGKIILTVGMNTFLMYLLYKSGTFQTINILGWLSLSFTPLLVLISAIIGQFAVYASEVTDGLDAHLMGIFNIVLVALSFLLIIQGNYTFLPFIAIMIGVISVDLYFNIPPARFWNGGPGAMPLAFATFYISLVTNNLIPYLFMTSIMWITLASSFIQIISIRFFKTRVFKIAPIHHHFQAIGWPKDKVTMRFWLFTSIFSILGILIAIL